MVVRYWDDFRQRHKPTMMILRCVQQSNLLLNLNQNWTVLPNNWWKWKRLNLVSIYFMRGKRISSPSILFFMYVFCSIFLRIPVDRIFIEIIVAFLLFVFIRVFLLNFFPSSVDYLVSNVQTMNKMMLIVSSNLVGIISRFEFFVTNVAWLQNHLKMWFSMSSSCLTLHLKIYMQCPFIDRNLSWSSRP